MRKITIFVLCLATINLFNLEGIFADNTIQTELSNIGNTDPSLPSIPSQKGDIGTIIYRMFSTTGYVKNNFIDALKGYTSFVDKKVMNWNSGEFSQANIYDSGGKIGIGISNPAEALDVAGNIQATGYIKAIGDLRSNNYCDVNGNNCFEAADVSFSGSTLTGGGASNYVAKFTGGGSLGNSSIIDTGTQVYTTSNFGIGTINPTYKLDVVGDALINSLTLGRGPGNSTTSAVFGYNALGNNTTGTYNTAIGNNTLAANTTGYANVALGSQALYENISGIYNVALGNHALFSNTTGSYNTATGLQALYANTTGNYNVANGRAALNSNTTGNYNTAVGYQALNSNTTGNYNTATGLSSLYSNDTGNYNVANGARALQANTTGNYNNAIGYATLINNTTGNANVANGAYNLYSNTTGTHNSTKGYYVLTQNTTGSYNVADGSYALRFNTEGNHNNAIGYQSVYGNTTGSYNIGFGGYTLYDNQGGSYNTALGYNTARGITTGNNNTIIGARVSGLPADLNNNVIIADGSGNQRIRVLDTGNVGIGTTTPTAKLDVGGGIRSTGFNAPTSGVGVEISYIGGASQYGQIYSYDRSLGTYRDLLLGSGGDQLWLRADGNVGIGTTTPTAKLDVAGDATVQRLVVKTNNVSSTSDIDLSANAAITTENNLYLIADSDNNETNAAIIFGTNAQAASGMTEHMRIIDNGNVGIGINNPSASLDVSGDIRGNNVSTNCVGNCPTSAAPPPSSDWSVAGNLDVSGTLNASNFYDMTPIESTTTSTSSYIQSSTTTSGSYVPLGVSITIEVPAGPRRKYLITAKHMVHAYGGANKYSLLQICKSGVTNCIPGSQAYEYLSDGGWHTVSTTTYRDLAPGTHTYYMYVYQHASYQAEYHRHPYYTNIMAFPLQ